MLTDSRNISRQPNHSPRRFCLHRIWLPGFRSPRGLIRAGIGFSEDVSNLHDVSISGLRIVSHTAKQDRGPLVSSFDARDLEEGWRRRSRTRWIVQQVAPGLDSTHVESSNCQGLRYLINYTPLIGPISNVRCYLGASQSRLMTGHLFVVSDFGFVRVA